VFLSGDYSVHHFIKNIKDDQKFKDQSHHQKNLGPSLQKSLCQKVIKNKWLIILSKLMMVFSSPPKTPRPVGTPEVLGDERTD